MLIVISSPTPIADEALLVNALFEEGLEVFHLRKPEAAEDEIRSLLKKIKLCYRPRIALHQQHKIAKEFGLNRLHFTAVNRNEMREEELLQLKELGCILSTSIHQTEEYKQFSLSFSYAFFGPVFNSISKKGYTSSIPDDFVFPARDKDRKVIALGGISETNVKQAMNMKFDDVAMLGTIWQNPDESIQKFKAIKKHGSKPTDSTKHSRF